MLNNKRKRRIIVVAGSGVLGLLFLLLLYYLFQVAILRNINVYQANQSQLADQLMNYALSRSNTDNSDMSEALISCLKEEYPTSSSDYCIVTKNDSIEFYKDENTTSTLISKNLEDYLYHNISLRDRKRYILSTSELQRNGDTYRLILCTKEDYYLKKIKLPEIRLYCIGCFFLYEALLIVVMIFNLYKIYEVEKSNTHLKNELRRNRKLIELLENDRSKHYVNSEKEFSFYNRSIVEEVIANMTEAELKSCIQVDIMIENPKMEHFIFITAILGRIKGDHSVACYWESNLFKVLLLHSTKKEALDFMNLFISKYKSESEEKVEELKVVATKLKK